MHEKDVRTNWLAVRLSYQGTALSFRSISTSFVSRSFSMYGKCGQTCLIERQVVAPCVGSHVVGTRWTATVSAPSRLSQPQNYLHYEITRIPNLWFLDSAWYCVLWIEGFPKRLRKSTRVSVGWSAATLLLIPLTKYIVSVLQKRWSTCFRSLRRGSS